MRHTLALTGILASAMCADPARAQDGDFSIGGTMRVRYETIDGQPRTGFNAQDDLVSLRTTLAIGYDAGPVRFDAELYDSRAWRADTGTPLSTGEVNSFELVQAQVSGEIDGAFGPKIRLKLTAGRFPVNLGSRRLVAADDYRNTTNGYTGVRADLTAPGAVSASLIYVLPQARLPDDPPSLRDNRVRIDREGFDLVLWGGLIAKRGAIGPALAELSYFHLGERDAPGRPTRDRSLDTIGARLLIEPRPGLIDAEVEGLYQFGRAALATAAGAPRFDVSATFVHAEVGYTFANGWKPRVALEFDRASGDAPGGTIGRFDTLFGMRRADLAPSGLYNAVGRANLVATGVRVEATPDKRVDAFIAWRPVWLAAARDSFSTTGVRDATGRAGGFAGQQWDARVRYWLRPDRLRFEGNLVFLDKGRFLQQAPNRNRGGDTVYLSLNLTAMY